MIVFDSIWHIEIKIIYLVYINRNYKCNGYYIINVM